MKKATAFLTLISLLAILGGAGYLYQNEVSPNLADLQPAIDNLKTLIPANLHTPALAGTGILLFITILLALMVLFERKQLPASEKPQSLPVEPAVNPDKALITDLQQKLAAADSDREQLKGQLSELCSAKDSLKAQLDKLAATAADNSELTAAAEREKALAQEIRALKLAEEKAAGELKTAFDEKKRLQSEVEALVNKAEKADQECKNARRETEKVSSQLRSALSESEKKLEEAAGLRQQLEAVTGELKAAQANVKGGKHAIPPAAYQILYLFQKEGRLIDLLSEDISELDDETLGGAIRPIHEGCRKLLADRLILERVLDEDEGSMVTLDEIDPEAIKLSGKVPSTGPYKGELIHRGWRLKECNLPELVDGWKGNVIAPAEIEIS